MGLRLVLIGTYQAVKRGEVDIAGEGEAWEELPSLSLMTTVIFLQLL